MPLRGMIENKKGRWGDFVGGDAHIAPHNERTDHR